MAQRARSLRREEAQQRALERVARRERRDAVVRECAAQQREERLGDAGALPFHAAHEGAEPREIRRLAGAAAEVVRRAHEERLDVGEDGELVAQLGELAQRRGRRVGRKRRFEEGEQAFAALRLPVVAQQQPADLLARVQRVGLAVHADARRRARAAVFGGFDHQQHVARGDLPAGPDAHLAHDAGNRRVERDFGLHRLEHAERFARFDAIARRHVQRDDQRGRRRAHLTDALPREEAGESIDLDAHAARVRVVQHAQRAAADAQVRCVRAFAAPASRWWRRRPSTTR